MKKFCMVRIMYAFLPKLTSEILWDLKKAIRAQLLILKIKVYFHKSAPSLTPAALQWVRNGTETREGIKRTTVTQI